MKLKLCIFLQTSPKFKNYDLIRRQFGVLSSGFNRPYLPRTNLKMCILRTKKNFGFHSLVSRRTQHNMFTKKPTNPTNQNVINHSKLMEMLQNCGSVTDQITTFNLYVKLEDEDVVQRLNICKHLENLLKRYFPSCSIHLVGSSASGFGIKGCDVDLSFQFADPATVEKLEDSTLWTNSLDEILDMEVVPLNKVLRLTSKNQLFVIQKALQRCGLSEPFTLLRGRVPILNFYLDGLACDLSINNKIAVDSTRLMLLCDNLDTRVAPLVRIINYWAKQNNLIGGPLKFKSYALFLLVVFFLQSRKPPLLPTVQYIFDKTDFHSTVHNNLQDVLQYVKYFEVSENPCSVEQLLEEFFCFYGNFDFSLVICPRTSKLMDRKSFLSKKDGKPEIEFSAISIQDPLNALWNVTTGVNFKYCKHFLKAIISVCENFDDSFSVRTESKLWGLSSVLGGLNLSEGVPQTENVHLSVKMSSFLHSSISQDNVELAFQKICSVLETIFNDCLMFGCFHLDPNHKAEDTSQVSDLSLEKHLFKNWRYVTNDTWSGRNTWQLLVTGENPVEVEKKVSNTVMENTKTKEKEHISFCCECFGVYRDNDLCITIILKPINSEKLPTKFGIFLRHYLQRMFKLLL